MHLTLFCERCRTIFVCRSFFYWITLQIISSKCLPFEVGSDGLSVLGVDGSATKSETIKNKILRTLLWFFFSDHWCQSATLRDGPLEKWWEGWGIFSLHDFFFFRPLLVQEFFLQVKPSARIFFFSDKYCFVCHLLIKRTILQNNCCTLLVLIIIKDHFWLLYKKY